MILKDKVGLKRISVGSASSISPTQIMIVSTKNHRRRNQYSVINMCLTANTHGEGKLSSQKIMNKITAEWRTMKTKRGFLNMKISNLEKYERPSQNDCLINLA